MKADADAIAAYDGPADDGPADDLMYPVGPIWNDVEYGHLDDRLHAIKHHTSPFGYAWVKDYCWLRGQARGLIRLINDGTEDDFEGLMKPPKTLTPQMKDFISLLCRDYGLPLLVEKWHALRDKVRGLQAEVEAQLNPSKQPKGGMN